MLGFARLANVINLMMSQIQMPSGNKIIGHVYRGHINLKIYISSKRVTQGLCGSFDNNTDNDLFNRNTNRSSVLNSRRVIDVESAKTWR